MNRFEPLNIASPKEMERSSNLRPSTMTSLIRPRSTIGIQPLASELLFSPQQELQTKSRSKSRSKKYIQTKRGSPTHSMHTQNITGVGTLPTLSPLQHVSSLSELERASPLIARQDLSIAGALESFSGVKAKTGISSSSASTAQHERVLGKRILPQLPPEFVVSHDWRQELKEESHKSEEYTSADAKNDSMKENLNDSSIAHSMQEKSIDSLDNSKKTYEFQIPEGFSSVIMNDIQLEPVSSGAWQPWDIVSGHVQLDFLDSLTNKASHTLSPSRRAVKNTDFIKQHSFISSTEDNRILALRSTRNGAEYMKDSVKQNQV